MSRTEENNGLAGSLSIIFNREQPLLLGSEKYGRELYTHSIILWPHFINENDLYKPNRGKITPFIEAIKQVRGGNGDFSIVNFRPRDTPYGVFINLTDPEQKVITTRSPNGNKYMFVEGALRHLRLDHGYSHKREKFDIENGIVLDSELVTP